MSTPTTTAVSSRMNIPVNLETRQYLEKLAERRGVKLAELGREALEEFIDNQKRKERMQRLVDTAEKYKDIIEGVSKDWSNTELDGLTDE